MVVWTDSPRARAARKTNLQLILSQHDCRCPTCGRNGNCKLQTLSRNMNILDTTYDKEVIEKKYTDPESPILRHSSKCIKCMRCIQVCEKIQGMRIWQLAGTGGRTTVDIRNNLPLSQIGRAHV